MAAIELVRFRYDRKMWEVPEGVLRILSIASQLSIDQEGRRRAAYRTSRIPIISFVRLSPDAICYTFFFWHDPRRETGDGFYEGVTLRHCDRGANEKMTWLTGPPPKNTSFNDPRDPFVEHAQSVRSISQEEAERCVATLHRVFPVQHVSDYAIERARGYAAWAVEYRSLPPNAAYVFGELK